MTKAFLHGRTEAIRTVQPHTVEFIKVRPRRLLPGQRADAGGPQTFFSEAPPAQKIAALRNACQGHVKLTKECSQGFGQDRCAPPAYSVVSR